MRSAAKVTRLLRQGRVPEVQPEYLVIKVSEDAEVLGAYREAGRVLDSLSGVSDGVVLHSLGLGTAKHIVLLERCNWNTFSMLARSREIESAIYGFWRRNGIPTGVVERLHDGSFTPQWATDNSRVAMRVRCDRHLFIASPLVLYQIRKHLERAP